MGQILNLQDEIHLGEEIQGQHDKRNQIFPHHSYTHKCNLPKKICKGKCIKKFPIEDMPLSRVEFL